MHASVFTSCCLLLLRVRRVWPRQVIRPRIAGEECQASPVAKALLESGNRDLLVSYRPLALVWLWTETASQKPHLSIAHALLPPSGSQTPSVIAAAARQLSSKGLAASCTSHVACCTAARRTDARGARGVKRERAIPGAAACCLRCTKSTSRPRNNLCE